MSQSSPDRIRVLHVDDSGFVDETTHLLERENDCFDVTTATSVADGLERLADERFDCLISDYDIPDRDGLAFLEAVREEYPDLPFILFTGDGNEEVAGEAITKGATDYLQKRNGDEQSELLAHRIRNAVSKYRTTQRAETLDRIRTLVADVTQALLRATSSDEVAQRICEVISDAEPYCFAWIGDVDTATDSVEPRASAGIERGYLDTVTLLVEESPTRAGPVATAVRDRRVAVSQNIQTDPAFDPWRDEALERGFQAVAAAPLVYEDHLYGILAVYADRVDAFDDTERDLLAELGDNVAHTLYSLRVQTELEQTNSLLSTLFNTLPVGVIAEDDSRNVMAVNEELFDLFDISGSPEQAIGRDCERLIDEVDDAFTEPSDFADRTNAVIAERESVENEPLSVTDDRTYERSYCPFELSDGDGHLWVYRDVTDRKERERELEAAKHRFTAVFNNPIAFMGLLEPDGTVIDINDTALAFVDRSVADVAGRPFWETPWWNHSEELQRDLQGWIERAAAGELVRFEADHYGANGERATVDGALHPIRDGDGTVTSLLAAARDISDRKQRERELERQNERLDEFAGIVSHDLRNPLNVASGHLELARKDCDSESLDAVADAHERMETLIDDLLTLAREGKSVEELSSVDITDLARDCWAHVSTADATLETEADRSIRADERRLKQLFENLLRNAVEHGGPDVTIRIGAHADGFYVADDGPGIPAGRRERVFDSGFSTVPDGSGLGLSIVEEIVEAHGWEISATDSVDGGTRFDVTGVRTSA